MAPAPSVVICSAPAETASIMSLPEPSWLLGNTCMSMRPPDFSFTSLEIRSAICTCGCETASDSPQRTAMAWARNSVGAASPAQAAAAPVMKFLLLIWVMVMSPSDSDADDESGDFAVTYPTSG